MKILPIVSLLAVSMSFTSCGNKIDYSSSPYIGANGSSYVATAGSGDNFRTMQFFFYPDGYGAWGSTRIVDDETKVVALYECDFTISGEVNVEMIQREDKVKIFGYFTTNMYGQVFVSSDILFYRSK